MAFDFNLDTTIKELYEWGRISVRTFNSLHSAGMETLGDILNIIQTPMDLLNLRNFGRKSYTEIEPFINRLKYRQATTSLSEENESSFLGDKLIAIITDAYAVVTSGDTGVKAYIKASYPGPSDMHELAIGNPEKMLSVVEEYTREENLEIRHSYKQFIDLVLRGMELARMAEYKVYAEYKKNSMNLAMSMEYFSYEQIARYFLSPLAKDYLEKLYQEQVSARLSARVRNFVDKYVPHFTDLVRYAEEPFAAYRNICPGQNMAKALSEMFQFNQRFKQDFDRVAKLTDDELQTEMLKHAYPFLTSLQRRFVFDFTKEHNHAPLFFLMLHYLRLSENRSNKIYCMAHGIFDGQKRTLSEIAEAMNLSRERVRQILCGTIEVQESPLAQDEGWAYYKDLFRLPLIYEKTEEFAKLKESEHLSDDFEIFASLMCLVADFKAEDVEGHAILVNNQCDDFQFSDCMDTLFNIINAKYSASTYVPIDSVLFTVPEHLRPAMKEIVTFIATEIYDVNITDDGQLHLSQNYVDVSEELYDILAKKGEPMHVEEIFRTFKQRYPDYKYTEPIQIKSFLYKHKHIKAIGKTSCYGLDTWEDVYFGSIRDLLVDLLSASDIPLHIDLLFDGVCEHYPNTSKASVEATMTFDNLQRFVEFEGGYFGLASKDYPQSYVAATTVQRYRFGERFQMFKEFVETYHRFPGYNGSDREGSLMRWYYNVTTGVLTIADEQRRLLDETVKRYDELGYPQSATEHEFLTNCNKVMDYIHRHHTLPTNNNAPELYAWLRRSRDNYDSYTDKRRRYMTELLNFILSFGFSI
ncbi:MAG: hypothetical protein IJ142_07425 [Bacteroidaceae bacterium]|nr:hypothetical protein [Bacteroidaceae bacterium]